MNYRTRYLNALRGEPVDRLPLVEAAQFNMVRACSDWNCYLREDEDPRVLFGFDNVGAPRGYESVPIDWYAVPRFEEVELPSTDGYRRVIDGRYGRVRKALPASADNPLPVRVFEGHSVSTRDDWLAVKERFQLSTEGRFPDDWAAWCEYSRTAEHPIVLEVRDIAATIANLMGQDGEIGMYVSFQERPAFIREMVEHLAAVNRICVEKALTEAQVDVVSLGSDLTPLVGPNFIREFFLEAEAETVSLARSFGIDLIFVRGRGDMRPLMDPYREIGVNGLGYVVETGDNSYLEDLVAKYGRELFYTACIDGRVLPEGFQQIEQEVDTKLDLARQHRMIPCLHATHVLPHVPWANYRHYAEYLREKIIG